MTFDEGFLTELLPGTWAIGATNFPIWLTGERLSPTFGYELVRSGPLVLRDTVSYRARDGKLKTIVGVDRLSGSGFTWRGRGLLVPFVSRWAVVGVAPDQSFVVIRFSKTRVSPEGVDIVAREGMDSLEIRALVAASTEDFGITAGEFASLTWLEVGTD